VTSTLNLGILAHVDAGKTSLTERLLFAAGVIDTLGSVDDGSTQTDTLALERQRGITIKSAVVSFAIDDLQVNIIDTPGHPDFIAEVERVLAVLDGAVLVISAVEGVQPQTRVLMRTLQRLKIPTLILVNKIDRAGADGGRVLRQIGDKLTPAVIAMSQLTMAGTSQADATSYGPGDAGFLARMTELLAEHDDGLLAAYVSDAPVPYREIRRALAAQVQSALVHPVFFGSAMTGNGIAALTTGIAELLPSGAGVDDRPVAGTVFKVERGPAGEKVAVARLFSGTLQPREMVTFGPAGRQAKVTAVRVFEPGRNGQPPAEEVHAGQIARLWGLRQVRIGDALGLGRPANGSLGRQFAPPTLETAVTPVREADRSRLHAALVQLAEQDPLINLRMDEACRQTLLSLYGEVQKQVIEQTLAEEFGVAAEFSQTTTICVERLIGSGAAVERMDDGINPFRATLGLRVDPAPAGAGTTFRLGIEPGSLPSAFIKAVEATVHECLQQGLYGWQVTDCAVTLTESGYIPPPPYGWSKWSSSASDFRQLTPLVLMTAVRRAGTAVYAPWHRFELEAPAGSVRAILPALARLGAVPRSQSAEGQVCWLEGDIPADRVRALQLKLPSLTGGEGVLDCAFDRYELVRGIVPSRPRSDANPLNRAEYLLHVAGRARTQ
jgi:ribosomal protection tetracycline resistance protein